MALWACRSCTTRFSVGAPACPHCGSTDHYEEGGVMAKITVHAGASIAGAQVVGASWGDTSEPDERPTTVDERQSEPVTLPEGAEVVAADDVRVSVDGVDQGLGEVVEFEGEPSFEPLPEVVEGDTNEHVSEPDYEAWSKTQLQEALAARELPTSGTKAELVARLRTHDEP